MMLVTLLFIVLTCSIKPCCYGIEKGVLRRQQTSTSWHCDVLPFPLLPIPIISVRKKRGAPAVTGCVVFSEILSLIEISETFRKHDLAASFLRRPPAAEATLHPPQHLA